LAEAHSEGFTNKRQKAIEKALLFKDAGSLVFGRESIQPSLLPESADRNLFSKEVQFFSWSRGAEATIRIVAEEKQEQHTIVRATYLEQTISLTVPFTDKISIDNAITCWCVLLQMKYPNSLIQERLLQLEPVDMRMQLKKAIYNCYLLNDSYSNDLSSLDLALDYLQQQAGNQLSSLIISDILQSGMPEEALYRDIALRIAGRGIDKLIAIGPAITKHQKEFYHAERPKGKKPLTAFFYQSTTEFLQQASTQYFKDEYILLKGARIFEFERISNWLEQKVHQTVMEINLSALVHNLKEYQKVLRPETKLMAMVKAFSYGSGSAEVARILQYHKVDYLAVAYADEGVELRKAGISLPIMVMNPDEAGFDALATYNLEPEIYSFPIYRSFHDYLNQQGIQTFPVHIKFNTGMNRLGFEISDAIALAQLLKQQQTMAVKSVFSHLVASESPEQDHFTERQIDIFAEACDLLQQELGYSFIRHIANSAAIFRHPGCQFDMVRLGIGLYGVDGTDEQGLSLETVIILKSTIAQIREVKAGATIGYSRKGDVSRDSLIATVRIGYADGYDRRFGNGTGSMYLHGKLAPVIGHVCMDMAMIDVTDIPGVREEDEVEIFGKHLAVQQLAKWSGTIAYEIMTGISQRVKRVYMGE
ncbi:MAG: alanine racemase, partial [Bacteroidota bacterium]